MSGLGWSTKVFEIGEVVQLDAKRKEFCKRTGIRICHVKDDMLFMKTRMSICNNTCHLTKYTNKLPLIVQNKGL